MNAREVALLGIEAPIDENATAPANTSAASPKNNWGLRWKAVLGCGMLAGLSFNLAYALPSLAGFLVLTSFALTGIAHATSARLAFYCGLFSGFVMVAPQLAFFHTLFGPPAVLLWLILALWIAAFTLLGQRVAHWWGRKTWIALIPVLWLGFEYFRSELYYLRFSWLNLSYAFADAPVMRGMFSLTGMYGFGALLIGLAAVLWLVPLKHRIIGVAALVVGLSVAANHRGSPSDPDTSSSVIRIVGIQAEFPEADEIIPLLDQAVSAHPDADVVVMSEYTMSGDITETIRDWCRDREKHLVIGGKQKSGGDFRNTAFVVDPRGETVFTQAKSVPIQFFDDGLPADSQQVWNSPWGPVGIAICYDLSYTRVMDNLVRAGAGAIIVPTMDVVDWGEYQHNLHALVAPVRAAEMRLPVFRLASSGVSQVTDASGRVISSAPFPGPGEILYGEIVPQTTGGMPLDRHLGPLASATVPLIVCGLLWTRFKGKHLQQHAIQTQA